MANEERFTCSGLNSNFPPQCSSIEQYIEIMNTVVSQARCDLSKQFGPAIVKANTPHLSLAGKQSPVVILIHGLLDSSCVMKSLHKTFSEAGMTCLSLLLPGHGTRPGDLLKVSAEDWLKTLQFAINQFINRRIILVGYSLGATLAVVVAQMSLPIEKLILLAPGLEAVSSLRKLIPAYNQLKSLSANYVWHEKHQDTDYAKYQSLPVNAMYQFHRLTKLIKKNNKKSKLTTPIKIIVSTDDETICYKSALDFLKEQHHPLNNALVYSNDTKNNLDNVRTKPSYYPLQNILNFSHTAIPVSPEHNHYGMEGNFNDYLHYQNKPDSSRLQKPNRYGAATHENLSKFHINRLHYNPDYDTMVQSLIRFINIKSN